jgi:hypothetical protein
LYFILLVSIIIFLIILLYLYFNIKQNINNTRKKLKISMYNNRLNKINNFLVISENILIDILESLKENNGNYEQVYALFPLLVDTRKYGENLAKQRKFYHLYFYYDKEIYLLNKIDRLNKVEKFIKSISKSHEQDLSSLNANGFRKASSI